MGCAICPPEADNDNADKLLPDMVADANALSDFIADAVAGAIIGYHIGTLARDRYRGLSHLPEAQRCELGILADYALRLADAGWAHLVQRRLGEERFVYLLVVRPRRRARGMQALPSIPPILQQDAA